jgi:hypothetical protein
MQNDNPATPPTQPSPASDLATLHQLSDAELSAIAQGEIGPGDVTRLQWLLEENADNALTTSERAELAARAVAAEHFTRRRERAAAILAQRQSSI